MRGSNLLLPVWIVLILSNTVLAWGPYTSKYICHEAVTSVWGVEAVAECIPTLDREFLAEFCQTTYDVMGQEYEQKCHATVKEGVEVHPSLISYDIFNDEANHFDFSGCPINQGTAKAWICDDSGSRPAYDMSQKWFQAAESAPNLCMRIYDFCVAASYYADSESIIHQVKYVSNNCVENIEASIDRCLQNGSTNCRSSQLCRFNNQVEGLGYLTDKEKLGESTSTMNRIITNLTARGLEIKKLPFKPRLGTVLLANTIDLGRASEFLDYLTSNGVNVITSNLSEFERLKYNKRIIILGGQFSPQGVGEVAALILSQTEEDSLLEPNAGYMFIKEDIWAEHQKVIVLAGNEAQDTRRVWDENKFLALDEVKSFQVIEDEKTKERG